MLVQTDIGKFGYNTKIGPHQFRELVLNQVHWSDSKLAKRAIEMQTTPEVLFSPCCLG